jgi:two-component SAPR family response regulator
MEWLLLKHGLHTARDLYTKRRYQECLKLTSRLLEVDPLHDQINLLFLQSSLELQGLRPTLSALEALDAKYNQGHAPFPPAIRRFWSSLDQHPLN